MNIDLKSRLISSTPVLDTNIYASADRMGSLNTLSEANDVSGGISKLVSLVIVDQAKQKAAFEVLFFNAAPTVASADNAALDISDAEMASKFIGRLAIAQADYTDIANNSYASFNNLKLLLQSLAGSKDLFYILRCGGTPTYAASDLILKFGFEQ